MMMVLVDGDHWYDWVNDKDVQVNINFDFCGSVTRVSLWYDSSRDHQFQFLLVNKKEVYNCTTAVEARLQPLPVTIAAL